MVNVFVTVVNMSITASVVAVVLLALRALLAHRLPATFCYLMWGIVIFRLLVPWSLPHAVSIFNLVKGSPTPPDTGSYVVTMEYIEQQDGYWPVMPPDNYNIFLVLATVWATVVVIVVLYCLISYWGALHRASTAFVIADSEVLQHCKQLTGVRRRVRLYRSNAFDTPVVVGVLCPRIVLCSSVDTDDTATMTHIITHELIHIKRLDHISKLLLATAFILHWFNPLLWLCAGLVRKDIEQSCDEKVLSVLGEDEKVDYAETLLRLCSTQHRLRGYTPLAFGESAVSKRVYGSLNYKRLTRLQTLLFSVLVLVIGLVTSTNAVTVTDGYRPVHNMQVDSNVEKLYQAAAVELSQALTNGDPAELLALAGRTDTYYLPTLAGLERQPLVVQGYKLYPQQDKQAYCYLRLVDDREYVAELVDSGDGIRLVRLQQEPAFAATMSVPADSEPVRFVRNMHRFGLYTGLGNGDGLPRPAVAALCIDEEYRDRVKAGELPPDAVYLPPEWVAKAAKEYFDIESFSYTFDEELYSEQQGMYIYDPQRGTTPRSQVIAARRQGEDTLVTAQLYDDPLFLYPKGTVTYTLRLK